MARKLTEDFIGTCQWCFGEYKVNSSQKIFLHGYTRPGYGYTIGQCNGVGHSPYEYSHELTDQRIVMLKKEIAKAERTLAMIDADKVNKVPNPNFMDEEELEKQRQSRYFREPTENLEFFDRDHGQFAGVLRRFRANVDNRLNYDKRTLVYFNEMIAEWKKGEIVGIDTPATGKTREMSDAYDPDKIAAAQEREAAKAAREAKPGKITILLYRESHYQFHHLDMDQMDKRLENLEKYHEDEANFKKSVKAWAKATFPGKVWVGDAYSGDYARHDKSARSGAWCAVSVRVEWQYLNDVLAMFRTGDHVYRADRSPKDVRLFAREEAFPQGIE